MTIENIFSEIHSFPSWVLAAIKDNDLIIALFAAGIGSFVGATSAQRVIENLKSKELELEKIRNVNVSIAIITHINFSLIDNMRTIKSFYKNYFNNINEIDMFLKSGGNLNNFNHLRVSAIFVEPQIDINNLQKIIFNDLTLDEEAIAAFSYLDKSIKSLKYSMQLSNTFTNQYLSVFKNFTEEETIAEYMTYYGFDYKDCLDVSNKNLVEDLLNKCNDGINSCMFLIAKLISYGKVLKLNYSSKAPEIFEPYFGNAFLAGLIPKDQLSHELNKIVDLS